MPKHNNNTSRHLQMHEYFRVLHIGLVKRIDMSNLDRPVNLLRVNSNITCLAKRVRLLDSDTISYLIIFLKKKNI